MVPPPRWPVLFQRSIVAVISRVTRERPNHVRPTRDVGGGLTTSEM